MRHVLAALMGLIALGGVQARSLPGMENTLGKRAPEFEFNPGNEIAKRLAAPPGSIPRPPTRPQPARPPPGTRPVGGSTRDDEVEQNDLADTSDVISMSPCGAAKRGLEELELSAPFDRRMSSQEMALPWDAPAGSPDAPTWQTILLELDAEVGNELSKLASPPAGKIRLIWAGGISGLRLGSRGPEGVTGDIDMTYHKSTTEEAKGAVKSAILTVLGRHTDILKIKPLSISNSLELFASDARLEAWSASDTPNPWSAGKFIEGVDGDWGLQLFGKLNRMFKMMEGNKQLKERDQADAKAFLQEFMKAKGVTEVTMEHFNELAGLFEKDQETTDNIVSKTIKLVAGEALVGVAQNIKDLVTAKGC
ncbi:hypothetical protein BDV96DRAFT_596795 [Lophiotrema nucula]|uniref:Uncharacterized protein n=1 Tax=Lophiotrema nucula TaxID=690887 RepID=A0A6A5ZKM9_9PLEO|nr:hypothetical protein BDV96DRAFT_596795 [Lophiotrema nucula]